MAIPEMPDNLREELRNADKNSDFGFLTELESYLQACHAAGQKEKLPPWPPEHGKVFVIGKGLNFCGQVLGRWNGTNWDRRLDIPGEKWFSDEPSDGITAAYLLGELEEV